jgi:lipopolysaccharide export system permease protein
MGLCAINFTLLALPLSVVNPRRGRSYQYGLALLVFIFYYNLLNIGQNAIASGRYGIVAWTVGLHSAVLALSLMWLWVRHHQWSWRDLLQLRRHTVAPQSRTTA